MGIEMFRHTSIGNPRSVLAGIFLGAYMDSPEWREQTEDYFGRVHGLELNMHKGLCTAGNLDALKANGLTLSGLSSLCSDSMNRHSLASLMESGCVVDFSRKSRKVRTAGVANKYPYVPVYVELSRGPGISDDAAFNYASIMYGLEAGFGLILIDAVDTIDKCVPRIKRKGEDELLGDFIREKVKKEGGIESFLGVTDQDILNLIYACAIDREKPGCWPSCSQRRFLEYAPNGNYALLNHIDHVRHVCNGDAAPGEIKLSINEIPSRRFYTAFRDRIQLMLQKGIISKDEARHPEHLEYFEKNGH